MEWIAELMALLEQIGQDFDTPKNIKNKIRETINALQEDKDVTIKASKAIQLLDEISSDPNIPIHIRPQIWNIVSMLEDVQI